MYTDYRYTSTRDTKEYYHFKQLVTKENTLNYAPHFGINIKKIKSTNCLDANLNGTNKKKNSFQVMTNSK